MDPDYSAYIGKDEGTLQALLDVTPEFSERRKIRAAIRALKNNLTSLKTPARDAPVREENDLTRRGSLIEGFSSPRERRESLRKEHGMIVSGEGLQRELRLLEKARNPYDDVKDENILTQLLKKSTELDDRVKIRAALRKLREEKEKNESLQDSETSEKTSNGQSNSTTQVNGKQNDQDYSQIQDVRVLENMLSDVVDYEERKQIRRTIQQLRKQQLAAVAVKYSRNNSPDTVTSDVVSSETTDSASLTAVSVMSDSNTSDSAMPQSDSPQNTVVPETVQSRLVVTLNNPSMRKVHQPDPHTEATPPLPISPPPSKGPSSTSSNEDSDHGSTQEEEEEQQERQVQVKNLKNIELTNITEEAQGPRVPVRTSSLKACNRSYPWTSTKVNLRVNGKTVSDDSSTDSHTATEKSDSSSVDASPSSETANSICSESDISTKDNLSYVKESHIQLEDHNVMDNHSNYEQDSDDSPAVKNNDTITNSIVDRDTESSPITCDMQTVDTKDTTDGRNFERLENISPEQTPLSMERVSEEPHQDIDVSSSNNSEKYPSLVQPQSTDVNSEVTETLKSSDTHSVLPPTADAENNAQTNTVLPSCGSTDKTVDSVRSTSPSGSEKPLVSTVEDAMEVLRGRLTYLEDELDSCENFDERREIRAAIRDVRAQIREETLKLSQSPSKGKPALKKALSTQDPGRPGKPLTLSRSFSSKAQGRNFLARKLKCQLGRSHSTKATSSPQKEEPENTDSDVPVFCAAPITRQYSRHDASTAPRRPTDSAPVSRSGSSASNGWRGTATNTKTGSAPVSRSSSSVGASRPDGNNRNHRNSENKRKFLTTEGRALNMSKASSGYGSVSGSDDDKEEETAPRVIQPLSNVTHNDGDTVTLSCKVAAGPNAKISWYKESKLLKKSTDFKQEFDGTTATLVITEIFPDDTGEYKCIVSNAEGQAETIAYMTVLEETIEDHEAPDIVTPLENQEVLDGDCVTLTCGISGTPKPMITWFKDDKLLPNCTDFEQSYDGKTARLVIDEVFEDDTGEYKVIAKNSAGEVSMAALLDVRAKPSQKPEKTTSTTSLPTTTAQLPGPPLFTTPLIDNEVAAGEALTLSCTLSANPRPSVVWYRDGRLLRPAVSGRQTFIGDMASLELKEVLRSDAGEYECVARNDQGEARCSCTIHIKDITSTHGNASSSYRKVGPLAGEGRDLAALKAKLDQMKSRFSDEPANGTAQNRIKSLQAKLSSNNSTTSSDKWASRKQPGSSWSDQTTKMSDEDIDHMTDEDELHSIMTKTQNFEKRKRIRNRLKDLREKKAGSDVAVKLDQAKAKELKEKHFGGTGGETTTKTTKTEKLGDGSTKTTNVTTTRKVTKVTSSSTTDNDEKPGWKRIKRHFGLTPGGGGKVAIQRSPSAIKEMLLQWCRLCTKEYENVEITNFSSSWNNGMAFAALIHHFRPVFDYKKLNPKCRRGNFKLAFDVAEKFADIAPLLDVEDMVRMKNPDWKCVFTYVQSIYRKFRDEEGGPKPKVTTENET